MSPWPAIAVIGTTLIAFAPAVGAAKRKGAEPPAPDPDRIINESYAFRKEREPDMTEVELAMYERIVPMVSARPEFALTLLESMIAEQETSPAFEFVLGNVYYEQRRFPEAEARFEAAIDKFPTFLRAWENLGVLHFATERYADAIPCFTKVLSLGETEPRILGLLAFCQLKSGNVLAAESSYLQAYSRDPDNPDWIEGLLSTYLDSHQHARAEALLRQLLRLRPAESRFWVLLANTLHEQGRALEAIAQLDAARGLGVLEPEGLGLLGDLCSEKELFAEAMNAYRSLDTLDPGAGISRAENLIRALIAQHRLDEAERTLDAISPAASTAGAAAMNQVRAELLLAREDWAAAAEQLQELLATDPFNTRALLGLGRAEEAQGRDARALIHYEEATRLEPGSYLGHLKLANVQVRLRRYADAVATLDKALAVTRTPELVEYHARVSAMLPKSP